MDGYLWLKALHILAVISWMAGLLYLPRLFIYHCQAAPESEQSETFKVMERRLLRVIMTPAMIVAWLSGLALFFLYQPAYWGDLWAWGKAMGIIGLSIVHGLLARHRRQFAADTNQHSPKYFRIINEVPTLLMILIVIAVVVRPF